MTDYDTLLDDEMKAFIEAVKSATPHLPENPDSNDHREAYLEMCRYFAAPVPEGMTIKDAEIAGRPTQHYHPASTANDCLIIYFHGGGFVLGDLESHWSICADLSHESQLELIAVDYRRAPEHRHPVQHHDCLDVTRALISRNPDRPVILAGDSAGAWLAAMVSHSLRAETHAIIGQLLIYPTFSGDTDTGSYITHAHAPMLSREDVIRYGHLLFGEDAKEEEIKGPLRETDFSSLPASVIFSAECDPLHDDGPAYCDRLVSAGNQAVCFSQKGMVHGYLRGRHQVASIASSFGDISSAARHLSRQEWPY